MRTLATKQPTNDSAKQKKNGDGVRSASSSVTLSRSVSPLSTGMPLLQRKCACGGSCPRCKDELGIQTKLKISEPGDKYEQEADRIADEVMRMPEPSVQRQLEPEEEEQEMVQRKASGDSTPLNSEQSSSEVPPIVHEVLNSPGHPLANETLTFMESRFGHDFSQVRVHTDSKATESAQTVNALAYTVGQNVVFGTGKYAPGTNTGNSLLAHELAHVIQQRYSTPTLHSLNIASPDGADEREVDSIADQVMGGIPVIQPRYATTPALQRKMLNNVVTDFLPNPKLAKACVVHLHGEEHTALAVAKEIRSRRCVNLVHLDTTKRYVDFEIVVNGTTHLCQADPNRIFTTTGRKNDAILECHSQKANNTHVAGKGADKKAQDAAQKVQEAAEKELQLFADNDWGAKIGQCRSGSGSPPLQGSLPVLALHNNEKGKKPLIESYMKVAEKGDRLPVDPKNPKKKRSNPSMLPGEESNDFFFVTKPDDFKALSTVGNVLLQADPIPTDQDDGSLSVALANQRFINVEKRGRNHDKLKSLGNSFESHDSVYVKNYAMAADALDLFGVPEKPCTATDKVLSDANPATDALDKVGEVSVSKPKDGTLDTDAPVLDREPIPEKPPKGCQVFKNQSELDAQKDVWMKRLGRMPLVEIVNWIVGGPDKLPSNAVKEMKAQQKCMIEAMRAAKGINIAKGDIIKSERRTFKDQADIWNPKFNFTISRPFGQISDVSRKKCGVLIGAKDMEWNPKDANHRKCWTSLSGEEKEKEILMTSSAPGVSRHHAGTDFDFGRSDLDLKPEAWTGKGDFADAYRWLARNASTYGFIQPFNTKGGYGIGYTTERWHWSYYPIAQALLEFAKLHRTEIDTELQKHWKDAKGVVKPEFQFISKNWYSYLSNVEQ